MDANIFLDYSLPILLMYKGHKVLGTKDRQKIRESIKKDKKFSETCYNVVEEFDDFIDNLNGLEVIFPTASNMESTIAFSKDMNGLS